MVNVLDENGVRQLAQGIKDNCKKWAKDTRRRKQIIIGRAIRPMSVDCTGAENWYAFIDRPCIAGIPEENKDLELFLFVKRAGEEQYKEAYKVCHKERDGRISINFDVYFNPGSYLMYKVDRYVVHRNTQDLYLSYKTAPKTLKGTSLTQEWQNGKHVNNKKINQDFLLRNLALWFQYGRHMMGKNRLEYRRVVKMKVSEFKIKNATSGTVFYHKKETSWLNNKSNNKSKLRTGVYKVRDRYARTSWQTIYVKTLNGLPIKVVFK